MIDWRQKSILKRQIEIVMFLLQVATIPSPLWLKNIPKGQIMRVKRNCSTQVENFLSQSKILTERFKARGYDPQILEKVVEEVGLISRDVCLQEKNTVISPDLKNNKE